MSKSFLPFEHRLQNGLVVTSTRPEHAEELDALQIVVFPTLADEQRFKAAHYHKHLELFPEGQFVVLDGKKVVGMTSTIRLNFDFEHGAHSFDDIIQGGWLTSHEPDGHWLYGADIGTDPAYRRKGIARALYAARQALVRHLGLGGQVTVGMLAGYDAVRDQMTSQEFYERLVDGRASDPTVSAQMKIGFEPRGLLRNYLNDPVCDNCGVLLVLDANHPVTME